MDRSRSAWDVFAADIGVIRNTSRTGFAWWADPDPPPVEFGRSLDLLARRVASAVASGRDVAVGFECPLFLPIPPETTDFSTRYGYAPIHERWIERAVPGEAAVASRAWYKNAGGAALAKGLVVLRRFLEQLLVGGVAVDQIGTCAGHARPGRIWIWEAFISSVRHRDGLGTGSGHSLDARLAVRSFRWFLSDSRWRSLVCETDAMRTVTGDRLPIVIDRVGRHDLSRQHVWNLPESVLGDIAGRTVDASVFREFTIVRPLDAELVLRARLQAPEQGETTNG